MRYNNVFLRKGGFTPLLLLIILLLASCSSVRKKQENQEPVYDIALDEVTVVAKPSYQETPPKVFALQHTVLDVKPNWSKRELDGVATLTLAPYAYAQDSLHLDAKGMDIHGVMELQPEESMERPLPYTYDKQKLHIKLPHTLQPGEEVQVRISYTAKPYASDTGDVSLREIDRGLYFVNAAEADSLIPQEMWSQGETEYNSAWFPTLDEPNQKHTQEIYITVDNRFTTLSNGLLVYSTMNRDGTRTDYWQMDKPHAPYLTMIAAGNWTVVKDNWHDSVPVSYYVEPAYKPYARMVFGRTPEMMSYFSGILHYPYPWPSFSQVVARNFISGAMENTTAVVHYDELQHDTRAQLDNDDEDIICHELFHHWFGDLVTTESWSNLALNESFATLAENLWIGYAHGAEEAAYHRQEQLQTYLSEAAYKKEPIFNYYYQNREDLFDHHRYDKGGLVLEMMRNMLGDSVFFHGLHIYLQKNAYGSAEIANLRLAMEEASGLDMHWFFNQWFLQPGHPQLVISQQYDTAHRKLLITTLQAQKDKAPVYQLPATVEVFSPQGIIRKKLWLKNIRDTFRIDVPAAPLLVNFDPEKILLAQENEVKPAGQWYYQYFHAAGYLSRYTALKALMELPKAISPDSLTSLLTAAVRDPFWNIRRMAYAEVLPSGAATVKERFVRMAQDAAAHDPKPKVRAAALDFLATQAKGTALGTYRQAMTDSSYEVTATGIRYVLQFTPETDKDAFLARLKAYESLNSSAVSLAVADVYAKYPEPGQADFFHLAPYRVKYYLISRYIDDYGKWLASISDRGLQAEIPHILGMDAYVQDLWGEATYKAFITKLVDRVKNMKAGASGLSAAELDQMAQKLSAKAETLKTDKEN